MVKFTVKIFLKIVKIYIKITDTEVRQINYYNSKT